MAIKASEKRFAAIKAIGDKYRPESNGYLLIDNANPEEIKAEIDALMTLGRTDRWKNAIRGWVKMIDEYPDSLEWAVLQGAIYAGWEAE